MKRVFALASLLLAVMAGLATPAVARHRAIQVKRHLTATSALTKAGEAAPAVRKASIVVGIQTLAPCTAGKSGPTSGSDAPELGGYCGTLTVPLDRTGVIAGTLTIGYELYLHTNSGASAGVILAQEGGPGFSTTGSRDDYLALLAPLRTTKDVLLVDKRGTGISSAINCSTLQNLYVSTQAAYASCGAQLGAAAYLYGSPPAADDVYAVVTALGYKTADYYGDSYGTWFGQVLAARYPNFLTTLVLDSAYPVLGDDATTEVNAGTKAMNLVCQRTPACAALGGSASARFAQVVSSLRAQYATSPGSITGTASGDTDLLTNMVANPAGLFLIIGNAGNAFTAWRDLDAADRAWLENADIAPLLRLVAEANDSYAGNGNPYYAFSDGLAIAVQCADYGAPFDLTQPASVRQTQYNAYAANLQAQQPNLFAPFTISEALNSQGDVEADDVCLNWSTPPAGFAVGQPVPDNQVFPSSLPVLVVNGEIDTVVSPTEGREAAALFSNSIYMRAANLVHITAISDGETLISPNGLDYSNCIGPVVQNFIATQGSTGSVTCAQNIRPIRAVPAFQTAWANVFPATAASGNQTSASGLVLASTVAETAGDVIGHFYTQSATSGKHYGLRSPVSGKNATNYWSIKLLTGIGYSFTLTNVKWTNDLTVNGTITWNQNTGEISSSNLAFTTTDGHSGTVTIDWLDNQTDAIATLGGTVDGATLAATRIAP